jgi:ketosteroid isomerase-like protein
MSKATVYVDRVVYYGGLQWQSNRGGSIMETHEPVNNHSDVAPSADRDNLAKEGIRKFNETVTAAFRNQDAAAMASLWTENARVLPPGQEMIIGRAAVQAFWQSGFDQGAYDLVLESPEIKSLGRWSLLRDRPQYCASPNGGRFEHRRTGEVLVHLPPRRRWRLARRCGHLQFNKKLTRSSGFRNCQMARFTGLELSHNPSQKQCPE